MYWFKSWFFLVIRSFIFVGVRMDMHNLFISWAQFDPASIQTWIVKLCKDACNSMMTVCVDQIYYVCASKIWIIVLASQNASHYALESIDNILKKIVGIPGNLVQRHPQWHSKQAFEIVHHTATISMRRVPALVEIANFLLQYWVIPEIHKARTS